MNANDAIKILARRDGNEPVFLLLGSDPAGEAATRKYAAVVSLKGDNTKEDCRKIDDALETADAMRLWPKT